MKSYMIILDGAGDRNIEILNNKTPLEYAITPSLDCIAQKGKMAYISVISEEIPPESDSGTMSLLSYNPIEYYPGRGTLEGIGAGFTDGYKYSASFRINFASFSKQTQHLDRRTSRDLSNDELQILAEELRQNITFPDYNDISFKMIAFGHHRGIISFVSNTIALSGNVTNTDPGFTKKGCFSFPNNSLSSAPLECIPLDTSDAAKNTATLINSFCKQAEIILNNNIVNKKRMSENKIPANCILFRDGGKLPMNMPSFESKFNLKLSIYGQLPSEKAIAKLINADFYYTQALELQLDNEYLRNLAQTIVNDTNDIIYVHLKGPDEPGHDGNAFEKVKAIEKIDHYFFTTLLKLMNEDDLIIVTCDHSTPCELKIHSTDNVPVVVSSLSYNTDLKQRFTEKDAKKGTLNVQYGYEVLETIFLKNRGQF